MPRPPLTGRAHPEPSGPEPTGRGGQCPHPTAAHGRGLAQRSRPVGACARLAPPSSTTLSPQAPPTLPSRRRRRIPFSSDPSASAARSRRRPFVCVEENVTIPSLFFFCKFSVFCCIFVFSLWVGAIVRPSCFPSRHRHLRSATAVATPFSNGHGFERERVTNRSLASPHLVGVQHMGHGAFAHSYRPTYNLNFLQGKKSFWHSPLLRCEG